MPADGNIGGGIGTETGFIRGGGWLPIGKGMGDPYSVARFWVDVSVLATLWASFWPCNDTVDEGDAEDWSMVG